MLVAGGICKTAAFQIFQPSFQIPFPSFIFCASTYVVRQVATKNRASSMVAPFHWEHPWDFSGGYLVVFMVHFLPNGFEQMAFSKQMTSITK